MKKALVMALVVALLAGTLGFTPVRAAVGVVVQVTIGSTKATINGKQVVLDQPPIIENSLTLVPFRFIGEAIGAKIAWNPVNKTVSYVLGNKNIVLTIGSVTAIVNGAKTILDVAPKILPTGRTVVPLRFVSENIGAKVDWNSTTRMVTVTVGAKSTSTIPDEIKIGVVGSMSGDQAVSGKAMTDAITFVKHELDVTGGLDVDGKKVKITFVVEDCESKPEITVNAIQKLIQQDKVLAIIGPNNSSDILAGGVIAQNNKIPEITHTGTNIKVTQIGNYIFRMCYTDPFQGTLAAKFVAKNLKLTKAAILYNVADAYSQGLHDAFVAAAKTDNLQIVSDQAFSGYESKDYTAQLTLIKAKNPEVLFLPDDVNTVPLMMQQARHMGIKAIFLGGDAWDYAVLPGLAGKDIIEGSYYITGFSPEVTPAAKAFSEAFEKQTGYRASFGSAMCYEAAHVILNAIQHATTIDGPGIRDAMAATSMDLLSGHVTFDADRNPIKGAVVLKVTNGTPTFFTAIDLSS